MCVSMSALTSIQVSLNIVKSRQDCEILRVCKNTFCSITLLIPISICICILEKLRILVVDMVKRLIYVYSSQWLRKLEKTKINKIRIALIIQAFERVDSPILSAGCTNGKNCKTDSKNIFSAEILTQLGNQNDQIHPPMAKMRKLVQKVFFDQNPCMLHQSRHKPVVYTHFSFTNTLNIQH